MASVSFSPGAAGSTTNFLQWESRNPPVGLVDASVLSDDSNPRYIQRVRFWRANRVDKLYLNAVSEVPDGSAAFDPGDDLNEEWEAYSAALVIRAGGMTWSFAGPAAPLNAARDLTEPYGWRTDTQELNDFIAEYEALTEAQRDATSITLNDGEGQNPLDAAGTLDGGLAGSIEGAASLLSQTPLDAAGGLAGGLAGSLDGAASLLSPTPLDAAGTLDGGLAGTLSGAASLLSQTPLDAAGTLDGELAGSLAGAASILTLPLIAAGTLDGGLAGTLDGVASLSPLPLDAAGTLTGGLAGSLEADAELFTPPAPPTAMERWLRSLLLPWDELTGRWATALALADTFQGLIDAAEQARHEWSPVTCRTATLPAWGRVLGRPRRAGESTADYRRRLALWRREAVGTSGWVLDEVQRITGEATPRVIEFPREGFVFGESSFGADDGARFGIGPSLIVGVEPTDRAAVEAALEGGVPPDVAIDYLSTDVFDAIG